MKARFFSFGFTQVQDEETQQSVLVQNSPNEIKIRTVFDIDGKWNSFSWVQEEKPRRASTFDNFDAYPEPLKIEKSRIRDLRKQSRWLPAKYRHLPMYNLDDDDAAASDSQEDEAD